MWSVHEVGIMYFCLFRCCWRTTTVNVLSIALEADKIVDEFLPNIMKTSYEFECFVLNR